MVKGGGIKMIDALKHCISICAPAVLVGSLQQRLESGATRVPSAASLHRNEFALDLGICRMRQRRYCSDSVRFLWSDSSLQLGYDLLWAQCHEVRKSELVPCFKAVVDLTKLVKMYIDKAVDDFNIESFDPTAQLDLPLDPTWKPLLRQLLEIKEHIFTPGVMASGRRSLTHKIETVLHMFCLDIPLQAPMQEYTDSFYCHTSDMGVEFSIPGLIRLSQTQNHTQQKSKCSGEGAPVPSQTLPFTWGAAPPHTPP